MKISNKANLFFILTIGFLSTIYLNKVVYFLNAIPWTNIEGTIKVNDQILFASLYVLGLYTWETRQSRIFMQTQTEVIINQNNPTFHASVQKDILYIHNYGKSDAKNVEIKINEKIEPYKTITSGKALEFKLEEFNEQKIFEISITYDTLSKKQTTQRIVLTEKDGKYKERLKPESETIT